MSTLPTTSPSSLPAPQKSTAYFELAVSLYLWSWPALTLAVQNEWGGPDSSDKRDWLAGTLADLFTASSKEPEIEDVEDVCVQVLSDEFSVNLEDDSAYEIAVAVCGAWKECKEGRFEKIEAMKVRFMSLPQQQSKAQKNADESDSSGTDAEVDEEQNSAERSDAMEVDEATSMTQQNREPVVDDDGFELVQPKGKGGRRR